MKPYYQEDGITIYHGDCREALAVDLLLTRAQVVLTDIPYNCSQESSGLRELDYGEWDKGFEVAKILPWMLRAVAGSIYIWCHETQLSSILTAFREHNLIDRPLAWTKTNPTVINGDKLWLPGIELCAFGKIRGAPFFEHCHPGWWQDAPDAERWHPCQKPLRIIASQIKASSKEDGLVLDPFMGSGTTLRAAKDLGRKAIGIEICEKYCEIAAKRLAQKVLQF